jgi:hypothetical protein
MGRDVSVRTVCGEGGRDVPCRRVRDQALVLVEEMDRDGAFRVIIVRQPSRRTSMYRGQ